MILQPVAIFRSPFATKFGIPRQSGLAASLRGRIVLEPEFRDPSALRGLEEFDYIWLIWEFSGNKRSAAPAQDPDKAPADKTAVWQPTVRPPRLGGNTRIGVFASRSPFRPNPLGLSCVRLDHIDWDSPEGPVIHVLGADLMDGTPIYDIKPYVTYADSRPDARCGFVDSHRWEPLKVVFGVSSPFPSDETAMLSDILAQDPRPAYHDDATKTYGMLWSGHDIRFRVADGTLTVIEIRPL
ncbi:MAG: tRNA (N6-threonylcarbamoyladenosine(37)-N6)-methyltransferase TrmO [Bacteroidales bacterium]|nr:tRNA (N6-threonylcarbamoyladenosine(37)-N6)-methyltransferase TrmO [Bacteroidales bacterium]